MKKILSLFFASVFALSLSAQVGYLIPYTASVNYSSIENVYDYLPQENSGSVEESPERKSYEWFNGVYTNAAGKQFFTVKDIKDGALLSAGVPTVAALWINVDRVGYSLEDFDAMFNDDFKTAVANYVKAGGNLYLSKQATRLVTSIGRCSWWPHAFANGGYVDGSDTWNMTDNFCANYNRHGHAMIKYVENYSDGWHFPLTSGEGTYRRTDNNSLWDDWGAYGIGEGGCDAYGDGDFKDKNIRIHRFESAQNCQILGGWGHTQGMDCAGFIEFFPNGDFKGTVVAMGLAAYQWGTSNTSVYNVKNLTKGILDYLTQTPNLAWNSETVPASGSIATTHTMTASATSGYTIRYSADNIEIANIGSEDGNIYYNYFGNATFHATATGDGWNVPKSTQTIASATIPVNGGNQAVKFAYVLPYSLHVMANYDNEEGRRPDFNSAEWFYLQFIAGSVGGQHGCFIRPSDLGSLNSAIKVLWIHNDHVGEASGTYYDDLGGNTFRDNLAAFVNAGGNVFVSKQATRLIGDLGRNAYPEYHDGEDGRGYADRGPWRIGNKWSLSGTVIDRSAHAIYTNMGTSTTIMASGRHTDNNDVWFNFDGLPGSDQAGRITEYETAHNCTVLGAWGHYDNDNVVSPVIENVGFVEYHPQTAGQGIIIAMGLASYHWAEPTTAIKALTTNVLNYLNAVPCALDGVTSMEDKLAEAGFYPSATTTFLTLHPDCEGFSAAYTLTDPNNIARIQEGVEVGNETITQLQFTGAGTVTLHIALTETRDNKAWPKGVYNYDREITFSYAYDRPRAFDNSAMEDKLADAYFYPANTTTFRTLHPVCEGLAATYELTSNPNDIARIQDGQLQFQTAGTVTLRVKLTESRDTYWPKGDYYYNREITFAYANANAAQDAVNADLSSNGFTEETIEQEIVYMAMRLHPSIRGLDSLSYTITNHHDATQGEAYKKTEDGVTRLYFTKSGKVLLTVRMSEPNWREEWTPGEKELTHVVEFNYSHETGPDFPWPSEFETGAVGPNSVITLPATVGGLAVTYTVEGDASLSGNVLTLADVESGSVDVHASITETVYKTDWPMGTYNYDNTLSFHAAEVGYLLPAAESIDHMAGWYEGEQPEYNAATWFQETYIATGKGRFVTVSELPTLFAKGITTLWVNIERISITPEDGLFTDIPAGLKTYIQAGGNVLLTKQATRLAYLMERIAYAPDFTANGYSTTDPGIGRCIYTRMGTGDGVDEVLDMSGHRIYTDMLSYEAEKRIFLVAPSCKKTNNYCSWRDFYTDGSETHAYGNAYIQRLRDFEAAWHATVFGIQGGVGDYCLSDIVEFNATGAWQGRILAIGSAAYQWGTSNNNVERDNLKTLTANCLAYLANEEIPEEVYTRDIADGVFGTICWGYNVEAGKIAGAEIYELTSFNAAGDGVILTEVNSMVGGRPYFFLGTSSQLRLTYTGQKEEATSYHGLVGYIPLTGEDPYLVPANEGKYILYNNQLLLVDSEIYLPVHRAYVNMDAVPAYQSEAPAGVRRRVMAIGGNKMPTGIEDVIDPMKQGTFDIMGRKLSAPQGVGFYIIDGQKVVITH